MKITLGYARKFLANWVRSGMDPFSQDVADAINEATMILLPKSGWDGSLCRMRFYVQQGTITLPREVETLLRVNMDNAPVQTFNRWYEFLNYGPGSLEGNSSGYNDVVDMGDGYAIHTDPSTPRQILVTADAEESNAAILIRGMDENGREVMVGDVMGESVLIDKNMPRYSTKKFSSITHVIKPVTKGYVYLSAYDPDPLARFDLATYHPDETNPCYRRYRVNGIRTVGTDADGTLLNPATATALVKLRLILASHDSDVLLIQSLPALKAMLQAQRQYDAGETKKGLDFEQMAVNRLNEQLTSKNPPDNRIDYEYGYGISDLGGVM